LAAITGKERRERERERERGSRTMVEGNGSKVAVVAAQKEEKVQLVGERKRERERFVDEAMRGRIKPRGLIHRVSRIIATLLRLELPFGIRQDSSVYYFAFQSGILRGWLERPSHRMFRFVIISGSMLPRSRHTETIIARGIIGE